MQWLPYRHGIQLHLDTTEHMAQKGKIAALQTATHSLIDTLKAASKKKDDIRVAIIPFTTFVNVDPKKNDKANWIDFNGWSVATSVVIDLGLRTDWVNQKTGSKWSG